VTHVDDPLEAAITQVENDSESQRSGCWADGRIGEGQETGFAPPRNDAGSEVLGAEAGNSVLDFGQA
jgi:hypothetical protein